MKPWKTVLEDKTIQAQANIGKILEGDDEGGSGKNKNGLAILMTVIGIVLMVVGVFPFFESDNGGGFKADIFGDTTTPGATTNPTPGNEIELGAAIPIQTNTTATTATSTATTADISASTADPVDLDSALGSSEATNPADTATATTDTTTPVTSGNTTNTASDSIDLNPTEKASDSLSLDDALSSDTISTTSVSTTTTQTATTSDLVSTPVTTGGQVTDTTVHTAAPDAATTSTATTTTTTTTATSNNSAIRTNSHTGTTDRDFTQYKQEYGDYQSVNNAKAVAQKTTATKVKKVVTNERFHASGELRTAKSGPEMWMFGVLSLVIAFWLRRRKLKTI